MLAQMGPRERFGYLAIVALLLFAFGVVGARYMKQPAPIVFETVSSVQPTKVDKPEDPRKVVVHVAGAVKRPGLFEFDAGARVNDAIEQAGGATDADLEEINLAAKLEDGTQLFVPKKVIVTSDPGQMEKAAPEPVVSAYRGGPKVVTRYSRQGGKKPAAATKPESAPLTAGSISLNTGSASDLDKLPGVGPATAAKIIEYRKSHGGFRSIDELLAVKGIGPKKLSDMRRYLRL